MQNIPYEKWHKYSKLKICSLEWNFVSKIWWKFQLTSKSRILLGNWAETSMNDLLDMGQRIPQKKESIWFKKMRLLMSNGKLQDVCKYQA